MVYTLALSKSNYKIAPVDINRLKVHEEAITPFVENLTNSILREEFLRHPVIVDKEKLVVLDGTHRIMALRKIDCSSAPACLVNYQDSRIKLKSFDRLAYSDMGVILDLCSQLGFSTIDCNLKEVDKILRMRKADLALVSDEEVFLLDGGAENLREISRIVWKLEEKAKKMGIEVGYSTKVDFSSEVKRGSVVIKMPAASKDEVVNAALSGEFFAPKTTRHIIPSRPMNIKAPLELLKKEDLREADELLTKRLQESKVKQVPPREFPENRIYEEKLCVFN
ncbi:hypothetical protein AKJ45_03845 [candidate division MSBL1 archaeon SCGC-AAA261F19]|uniref:ParB-like N-terminal domain-containing protein n=1 Tax=candidate division MSBL1 archaeon SCGC-AAA261F19 TaxID=1698275 RepID=A0A133V660_9EURY|nr:hypothetical protein AKJ45_03845 [candidate division MSBL1 archaeon SCGC-AAA261F19]